RRSAGRSKLRSRSLAGGDPRARQSPPFVFSARLAVSGGSDPSTRQKTPGVTGKFVSIIARPRSVPPDGRRPAALGLVRLLGLAADDVGQVLLRLAVEGGFRGIPQLVLLDD